MRSQTGMDATPSAVANDSSGQRNGCTLWRLSQMFGVQRQAPRTAWV